MDDDARAFVEWSSEYMAKIEDSLAIKMWEKTSGLKTPKDDGWRNLPTNQVIGGEGLRNAFGPKKIDPADADKYQSDEYMAGRNFAKIVETQGRTIDEMRCTKTWEDAHESWRMGMRDWYHQKAKEDREDKKAGQASEFIELLQKRRREARME